MITIPTKARRREVLVRFFHPSPPTPVVIPSHPSPPTYGRAGVITIPTKAQAAKRRAMLRRRSQLNVMLKSKMRGVAGDQAPPLPFFRYHHTRRTDGHVHTRVSRRTLVCKGARPPRETAVSRPRKCAPPCIFSSAPPKRPRPPPAPCATCALEWGALPADRRHTSCIFGQK